MSFEVPAESYDAFMGRYSRHLSAQLADLAGVAAGQEVLDVGCGPGALTSRARPPRRCRSRHGRRPVGGVRRRRPEPASGRDGRACLRREPAARRRPGRRGARPARRPLHDRPGRRAARDGAGDEARRRSRSLRLGSRRRRTGAAVCRTTRPSTRSTRPGRTSPSEPARDRAISPSSSVPRASPTSRSGR